MLDPSNSMSEEDLLKQVSKTDADSNPEEAEKFCKICYGADADADGSWVTPCKCSGTIKWVHKKCLLRWVDSAPLLQKSQCNACRYEYRRCWFIKPPSRWTLPKIHLNFWEVAEIFLDIYSTAKLVRYTSEMFQGKKSFFRSLLYFVFWKSFTFNNRRIIYYQNLGANLISSVLEPSIEDAV
ncbi:RING-variant domain-containing protein [Ditylenchus destructor]|uniref:E3 ubiquitin-protein ligase MARCHF5 n=1 Tax=Ditylenchus destructor TaxID=166010 RepID=A0AAD4N3E4_9BILA|nr:RING-variant domain-containing protein [Ditylenchus destructor]